MTDMDKTSSTVEKEAAGRAASLLIESGMLVGLGTGSTAEWFIRSLGERVKNGLKIKGVASSSQSHDLALANGIPLLEDDTFTNLDITVDGADEVDPEKKLIKGGGGALLREKIIAAASRELIIVIDSHKTVNKLGKMPLPIEVLPFGIEATLMHLEKIGLKGLIRENAKNSPFITDNGNRIIDILFKEGISHPEELDRQLKNIPGILETGLFIKMTGRLIIGTPEGVVIRS